jgi:hypothetical protein
MPNLAAEPSAFSCGFKCIKTKWLDGDSGQKLGNFAENLNSVLMRNASLIFLPPRV